MEKQIAFNEGLVCTPYSDVSADGQLSVMHDVEVHAGSVRPSVLLGSEVQLGGVLMFIHKTGDYTHYVYLVDDQNNPDYGCLKYVDDKDRDNPGMVLEAQYAEGIKEIAATGNVLTFLCEGKELVYGIWEDGRYNFLGVMPELDITFALRGEEKVQQIEPDADVEPLEYINTINESTEEKYTYISKSVGIFVDKFCNQNGDGFVYPFFVRAAWKLYDDSYVRFSEPVLMIPNSTYPAVLPPFYYAKPEKTLESYNMYFPYISYRLGSDSYGRVYHTGKDVEYEEDPQNEILWNKDADWIKGQNARFADDYGWVIANVMQLQYRVNSIPEEWRTIIKGVEIMISEPQPSFEFNYTDGNPDTGKEPTTSLHRKNYGYGKLDRTIDDMWLSVGSEMEDTMTPYPRLTLKRLSLNVSVSNLYAPAYYMKHEQDYNFGCTIVYSNDQYDSIKVREKHDIFRPFVTLQDVDEDKLKKKVDSIVFYHFKTILVKDLSTSFSTIPLEENQYEAIVTNTVDYKDTWSHDSYIPQKMLEYNSRLNIYNTEIIHYVGGNPMRVLPFNNNDRDTFVADVYVKINRKNVVKLIQVGRNVVGSYYTPLFYLFVPNADAVSYIIVDTDNRLSVPAQPCRYAEIGLEKSSTLDGVYFYSHEGQALEFTNGFETDYPSNMIVEEDLEYQANSIYTSETDNPFSFTAKGLNRIGGGSILKLAAMTKPLSEGQMGAFPLIAFCTDGNYALSVIKSGENAGLYDGVVPMRPDVCINAETIMGIEEGIFFVSQRGLMLMTENDALQLSEKLNGVKDVFGTDAQAQSPRKFIEECVPAWDYTNSRLLLLKYGTNEAYVYKADDKTWSTIELPGNVKKVLNSYPFSYIQFAGSNMENKVVVLDDDYNFDNKPTVGGHEGLIVTRPMKMDSLLLKRITEFALQGNFGGKQKLTLYGSNDLRNWHRVGTTQRRRVTAMRGYYFKYWRFKIETNLKENENLSGIEVKYTIKQDGRFR